MDSDRIRGSWPFVDFVVSKDYEQSRKDGERSKKPTCRFTIHMDIPCTPKDADDVIAMLEGTATPKEIHDKVKGIAGAVGTGNGPKVLAGAFGQPLP